MITRELFDYYQAGGLETAEELEVTIWPLHWAMTNHQSLCKPNKGHKLSLYTLISNTVSLWWQHIICIIIFFSRWFYFWGTKRPSQKRSTAHFRMRRWIYINTTTISIIIFITTIIIIIQVEGLIVPFLCLSDLRIASRLAQFQMEYLSFTKLFTWMQYFQKDYSGAAPLRLPSSFSTARPSESNHFWSNNNTF